MGTWVLSANQRNPGLTVRAVETLDEISAGQFVFGLGAGSGDAEARAFGLPVDRVVSRFEDALEIIIPMLRTGHAIMRGRTTGPRIWSRGLGGRALVPSP